MNVLQLTSDWKWTGPAEPMLIALEALRARGHRVDLVCPEPPPGANRSLRGEATIRDAEPIGSIPRGRSALAAGDGRPIRWLKRSFEDGGPAEHYDLVHCWHSRDHVLAARALGRHRPRAFRPPPGTRIVRSLSKTDTIAAWPWNRWLFGPACDGLVCVSRDAMERNRAIRGGRAIGAMSGAVDFGRLRIRQPRSAVRAELGVADDAWLVGVVARMQAHRRFDLLLEALRRVRARGLPVHLVVIGRGTRADEVVRRPAARLGVADRLILTGYRLDDYADVLGAMDVFTFLVPGSDGGCRALRQAAALGLPMVGTSRGAIPEIIRDGDSGLVVAEDAEALASAWSRLFEDEALRRRMAEAARQDAIERFRPERLAAELEAFYREVLGRPQG